MPADEAASGRNYDCTRPIWFVRGITVFLFRCWNRRRCLTCAELMSWDDTDWIRRGVDQWLSQGVSLVFLTLTLAEPKDYREVSRMWAVLKQALDRRVSDRPGYPGGLGFVRVFERQEKRYQRTGETVVHLHALIAGLQYRYDRLSGKVWRRTFLKAEDLGVDGAAVTKDEVIELAERYGFGPMVDISQVQAGPGVGSTYEVAHYLVKYLTKYQELALWLPKGAQVVAGSRGGVMWAGPGVTRAVVRRERLEAARMRREALRAGQATGEHPGNTEPAQDEPEQERLPIPWPPARGKRRR